MTISGLLQTALYTYLLHKSDGADFAYLPIAVRFGGYVLRTSRQTSILRSERLTRTIVVIGTCFDSRSELSDVSAHLLDNSTNLQELLELERHLAGKYVILYTENDRLYILGDATGSMQVVYNVGPELAVSSSPDLIAMYCGFSRDPALLRIRACSEVSQAMPNDLTLFGQVKQLLPNHYLDVGAMRSIRLDFGSVQINAVSIGEAASRTAIIVDRIACRYSRRFQLVCPITAGKDSRVVLAFLHKHVPDIKCYTLRHNHHHLDEPDLVIPQVITKGLKVPHSIIDDIEPPSETANVFDAFLGKGLYSSYTLKLAYTIKQSLPARTVINGDIIGQIGKSSLHRNIPDAWANTHYFMCKLHNYSRHASAEMTRWLESCKAQGSHRISVHDLFSWEIRMGRWAAQENYIYDLMGVNYLNIFNSRELIYLWVQTDRSMRMKSSLHEQVLGMIDPRLIPYPYELDSNYFAKVAKSNRFIFYLASHLKHWLGYLRVRS